MVSGVLNNYYIFNIIKSKRYQCIKLQYFAIFIQIIILKIIIDFNVMGEAEFTTKFIFFKFQYIDVNISTKLTLFKHTGNVLLFCLFSKQITQLVKMMTFITYIESSKG